MLAIDIHLLTGRYAAASVSDRTEPEWPPHPGRLYSAMVASWAEHGQDAVERAALEWLEQQEPPQICASALQHTARRHVVTHYVPGNDATAIRNLHGLGVKLSDAEQRVRETEGDGRAHLSAVKALEKLQIKARHDSEAATRVRDVSVKQLESALELLPENRNRQARFYPVMRPDHDHVTFVWHMAEPDHDTFAALEDIVARLGRLGHSSSLVAGRVLGTTPESAGRETSLPGSPQRRSTKSWTLRVPAQGLLTELERSFIRHQGREPRSLPAVYATYHSQEERGAETPTPQTAGRWWIFDMPPACRVRITRATDLTRALRAAIMSHAPDPLPPMLTGHGAEPDTRHAQWLALPMVGSGYSTGDIAALALAAPEDLNDETTMAIDQGVAGFLASGNRLSWGGGSTVLPQARTSLSAGFDPGSSRRRSAERGYWARTGVAWRTATPIALDRFPRAARSKKAADLLSLDDEIAQIVAQSCRDIGLPAPRSVQLIEGSPLVGVPPVMPGRGAARGPARFGFYRAASGQVRYSVHVQVVFDTAVTGPIILGAGRHFGYGLMFPMDTYATTQQAVRNAE